MRFRDTGVGIPPGDQRNLFIPFFTTKEKGTGLGLPISQRIIENHGGTIEVRSQPGEGATFTVLLPIESDAYAAYAEPKTEKSVPTVRPPDAKKVADPSPAAAAGAPAAAGQPGGDAAPPPVPAAARAGGASVTAGGRKG